MAQCYDALTGGFAQNCDRPIKSGLLRRGLGANVEDIREWIKTGNNNQFVPVLKPGKTFFPLEVLGAQPFNGTNVASAVDDFKRDFTKTVVFNIPESGSAAALRVEQLTKSQAGFVIIVEGKDAGGDLNGNFIIFGKDEPLLCTVAKDYVAGVSAPVITATAVERGYENFLFHTDLATTKTTFDTLYAGDLTKRIYYVEHVFGDFLEIILRLISGSAPVAPTYDLVTVYADPTPVNGIISHSPSVGELSGTKIVTNYAPAASSVIFTVLSETALESAGTPMYFTQKYIEDVQAFI